MEVLPVGSKPYSRDIGYLPELYITRINVQGFGEFSNGDKLGLAFSSFQTANGTGGDTGFTGKVGLAHDFSDSQFF